ncbi:MAG: PHP domain-containing protein [Eubacteriales bacterium]
MKPEDTTAGYKYDLHVHTHTSPCGSVSGADMVRLFAAAGYSGIMITDHYAGYFFDRHSSLPWEEQVEIYLKGYSSAYEEGQRLGLTVFMGMEWRPDDGEGNEYLVVGIDKLLLLEHPRLYRLSLSEFRRFADEHGLLIYQAHPFRYISEQCPDWLDGVEAVNACTASERNAIAVDFALQHNLAYIAGSDCHHVHNAAVSGIYLSEQPSYAHELADALRRERRPKLILPEGHFSVPNNLGE